VNEKIDDFNKNVFINCPFDEEYEPILQAILFCLVYLGLNPRIATETIDSGESRLDKIVNLIDISKYSIHDLSRCQASEEGEFYRLNMPFELGLDYGCRRNCTDHRSSKRILVLEEKSYRYQASISDLSGSDIQVHGSDFKVAIRKIRNWLSSESNIQPPPAGKISTAYYDFGGWYFEKQLAAGYSEEDIKDYPTSELLGEMVEWSQSNGGTSQES